MKAEAVSSEIKALSLHTKRPLWLHLYAVPILSFYPLLAFAYFVKYDEWVRSEEWTFLYTVGLGLLHALSFLVTRWSSSARAWITTSKASSLATATLVRVVPHPHRGQGEIVPLVKKGSSYTFNYQRDLYTLANSSTSDNDATPVFHRLPYPSTSKPPLNQLLVDSARHTQDLDSLQQLYGKNEFDIPVPTFSELFAEHVVAPFFVFQIFCVALWCLDEYWYYSIFTLFMLIMFECTVVWQRLRTLKEFRTMSVEPYPIPVWRQSKWETIQSDLLLPGDIVGISRHKSNAETTVPADVLLLQGSVIVNEAMLSGESTPLLKESIALLPQDERLDADGVHKGYVLFSGTKILQATRGTGEENSKEPHLNPPGQAIVPGLVLRTGFGTAQGSLVRTMIFSTERVSANNLEAFLFIGFLLIFAIMASWYVWTTGLERGMKKGKLLLHCVLIVTSVVPPELPMELSLAVNASLVALSKYAIFCTEPFRIPFAGRVDVCCFDKTGTITAENLVLEGVGGVNPSNPKQLSDIKETNRETMMCLAAAHALVRLDDGTVVGDPMEKTTLEKLGWELSKAEILFPANQPKSPLTLMIRRRFQFSSALKRMSTLSTLQNGKVLAAVKGAPETIKTMLSVVPEWYDETYKSHTRQGARVLALAMKEMEGTGGIHAINHFTREQVESSLTFVGFLVFSCPLKPDAVEVLRGLADSSHRCIMITGDNPLTACHVAKDVEIIDREALILDVKENAKHESELTWRTIDESKIIDVNPDEPLDESLFQQYDICITGAAMKQFETRRPESWKILVQSAWVYARVSPIQKENILTTLKSLGYITLMAGDGTNDVGALKQAHIGVALLDGTEEDLKKIAEKQKIERIKKVYESQLNMTSRFGAPPPPVPPAIAHLFPDAVEAQRKAAQDHSAARRNNAMEKFNMSSITDKMAEMEDEQEAPQIKLGDASCAAPFTSKLAHVTAITHIIRQGRCTLVATIQMYKILALNCLISAYALSVQYLDGIKQGDYQLTVTGMIMSVCFLCISRAKPVEKLSKERPLGNIFNLYVLLSVLLQFALHIVGLVYITNLCHSLHPPGEIDLEAEFEPNLLNTAIFLLSLSQQVSTFTINFQGRPFREGIRENRNLYYGLLGATAVAFSGSMDLLPELNRWLQVIEMSDSFKFTLTSVMLIDFGGCWLIEKACKYLFAELEPREMVTRGRERREERRKVQWEAMEKIATAVMKEKKEKKNA